MIAVKNLTKKYGDIAAVRDVSFTMEKGRVYGFLGPNGAGKSTTMNIITGCLAATAGSVTIDGLDIYEDAVDAKRKIGYLPELPPLYTDMTPDEYLLFVGRAKGLRGDALYREVERVEKRTGLTELRARLIRNLSKGYRQRVGIAQAILGDPEIIILDEPTVGLDPLQIIEIRELVRELGENHTVILSSHILSEISAVCDYVIIIAHGEIVAADTIENLTTLYAGKSTVDLDVRGDRERILSLLDGYPEIASREITDGVGGLTHLRLTLSGNEDIRESLFYRFADARLPILSMQYEEVTLEKVFLSLTEEKKPETTEADGTVDVFTALHTDAVEERAEADREAYPDTEEELPASEEASDTETDTDTDAEPGMDSASDADDADKGADKGAKTGKSGDKDDYTPLFGGR